LQYDPVARVGVDVAVDELEFVQPPYSLTGVHNADLRLTSLGFSNRSMDVPPLSMN
jgi:hypothetical protein